MFAVVTTCPAVTATPDNVNAPVVGSVVITADWKLFRRVSFRSENQNPPL